MGCLMLYGVGWTQRWGVSEASVPLIADEISRGGRNQTGRLPVLDPGTGDPTPLAAAWQHVAAAVIFEAQSSSTGHDKVSGHIREPTDTATAREQVAMSCLRDGAAPRSIRSTDCPSSVAHASDVVRAKSTRSGTRRALRAQHVRRGGHQPGSPGSEARN